MKLKSKDVLGIEQLTKDELLLIMNTTKEMKKIVLSDNKKVPYLQGKTVITLFYENSTRTRMSFELAAKYMGANAANISASASSVAKGETLIDTGKTLDMMGTDVIIIRHGMSGAPHLLAKHVNASVINAGDGMHEHPTQALLDIFSITEERGSLEGMNITIVGDIYHSRVARSNIIAMKKLGANVSIAAPGTLIPKGLEKSGVKIFNDVGEAVKGADVVMGLRIQLERQKNGLFPTKREYSMFYGVNEDILKLANKDVLLMHPGPVNRGVELTSNVVDSKRSIINEQVRNGVAVRMALLYLLTGKEV